MKQAILLSVQPKHVNNILDGKKTLEIRKTNPKCDLPIDVYIYCTQSKPYFYKVLGGNALNGKIVAKFTLNKVDKISQETIKDYSGIFEDMWCREFEYEHIVKNACLDYETMYKYSNEKDLYAWHIENLVVFDEPKELGDFDHFNKDWHKLCGDGVYGCYRHAITKAPQSWQYVWMVKHE